MTDQETPAEPPEPIQTPPPAGTDLPEVRVVKRRGFSIVWLVPLVAAAVGAWLMYQSFMNRGVPITIRFESAEGLVAGKTRIKLKAVEIGVVDRIRLGDNLNHIVVEATLDKQTEPFLTENTRFWVVRPRVGSGGVSGLTTVLSGVYIDVDPADGSRTRRFRGLEEPPVTPAGVPGLKLVLHARSLGSIDRGSPIFYSDLKVGRVEKYALVSDTGAVDLGVFIEAKYQDLVRTSSRFWNTSGFDINLTAEGLNLRSRSIQMLLAGGISFENPPEGNGVHCENGHAFDLYPSFEEMQSSSFTRKVAYVMYFDGSVHGLKRGAAVEFRGVKVGSVRSVNISFQRGDIDSLRNEVIVDIEPERFMDLTPGDSLANPEAWWEPSSELIARGMRAQLQVGSMMTGQLYVSLDFFPGDEPQTLRRDGELPEFPTIPSTLDQFRQAALEMLAEIRQLPIEDLVESVQETIKVVNDVVKAPEILNTVESARALLDEIRKTTKHVDSTVVELSKEVESTIVAMNSAVVEARRLMKEAAGMVEADSPIRYDLARTLRELASASRSIRVLADYLERHPEALIQGKGGSGGK